MCDQMLSSSKSNDNPRLAYNLFTPVGDSGPLSLFAINVHLPDQAVIKAINESGPGCSKLTTSLVNVSLKFQMLVSEICQYFLLKKSKKLLQCKSFSHFVNKNYQCNCL